MNIRITALPIALILTTLTIAAITGPAEARDIRVPLDASTINEALAAAAFGDRVLVAPGLHVVSDADLPAGVTLLGDPDDPASVVLDAQGRGRVLRAESVGQVLVEGVTITGGHADGETSYETSGGGVFVSYSQVNFRHVVFRGNIADSHGGGVRVSNGQVRLEDCVLDQCRAVKGGGGIDLSYSSTAVVARTLFRDNHAAWGGAISARTGSSSWLDASTFTGNTAIEPQEIGGAFFADYAAQVAFTHCILTGNAARQGGAARLGDALSSFVNCTITGNAAWEAGAGVMLRGGTLNLAQTIVAFNQGDAVSTEDATLLVVATDIYGNAEGDWTGTLAGLADSQDNMSTDPLFCEMDNLHLRPESPCAEENNPVGLIGALPAGCSDVSVLLSEFRALAMGTEVVLTWRVSGATDIEFQLTGRSPELPGDPGWVVDWTEDGAGGYRASDKPDPALGLLAYRLDARLPGGDFFTLGELLVNQATNIPDPPLTLGRVYPNPFNPRVSIEWSLGRAATVDATVFDIQGRAVRRLVSGPMPAGHHDMSWDGRDGAGRVQPAGTYVLRITDGERVFTSKLQLVK